jgi:hypothetical protein
MTGDSNDRLTLTRLCAASMLMAVTLCCAISAAGAKNEPGAGAKVPME